MVEKSKYVGREQLWEWNKTKQDKDTTICSMFGDVSERHRPCFDSSLTFDTSNRTRPQVSMQLYWGSCLYRRLVDSSLSLLQY